MRLQLRTAFSTVLVAVVAAGLAVATAASAQPQTEREFQECQNLPMIVASPAARFVMAIPAGDPGCLVREGPPQELPFKRTALNKYVVTSREITAVLPQTDYHAPL